MLIKLCYI